MNVRTFLLDPSDESAAQYFTLRSGLYEVSLLPWGESGNLQYSAYSTHSGEKQWSNEFQVLAHEQNGNWSKVRTFRSKEQYHDSPEAAFKSFQKVEWRVCKSWAGDGPTVLIVHLSAGVQTGTRGKMCIQFSSLGA